jgi:hypothetical protein
MNDLQTFMTDLDNAVATVGVPTAPPRFDPPPPNFRFITNGHWLERELYNQIVRDTLKPGVGEDERKMGSLILEYLRRRPLFLTRMALGQRPAIPQDLAISINNIRWVDPPNPPGPPLIPPPVLAIMRAKGHLP